MKEPHDPAIPQENIIHTQIDKCVQGSVHSTTVCSRQETGTSADAQTMMCPHCGTPLSPHKEASTAIILMTLGNTLLSDESQLQKNQTNKKPTHILILCEENFSNRTPRDNLDQWPMERQLGWRVSQWYRFHTEVIKMF